MQMCERTGIYVDIVDLQQLKQEEFLLISKVQGAKFRVQGFGGLTGAQLWWLSKCFIPEPVRQAQPNAVESDFVC